MNLRNEILLILHILINIIKAREKSKRECFNKIYPTDKRFFLMAFIFIIWPFGPLLQTTIGTSPKALKIREWTKISRLYFTMNLGHESLVQEYRDGGRRLRPSNSYSHKKVIISILIKTTKIRFETRTLTLPRVFPLIILKPVSLRREGREDKRWRERYNPISAFINFLSYDSYLSQFITGNPLSVRLLCPGSSSLVHSLMPAKELSKRECRIFLKTHK